MGYILFNLVLYPLTHTILCLLFIFYSAIPFSSLLVEYHLNFYLKPTLFSIYPILYHDKRVA